MCVTPIKPRGIFALTVRPCVCADPLFVACVQDNATWWFEKHGYAPKNGVAGVRAKQYAMWRDHIILEALRVFRARSEGVALDSVPPVVYARKPSADGRADGTVGQRGIQGFERCKVLPEAHVEPLPVDEPPLPVDAERVLLLESKAEGDALEEMYYEVLAGAHSVVRAQPHVKRKRKASPGPPAKRSRSLMEFTVCDRTFVREPSPGYCNQCGGVDGRCGKCGQVVCRVCAEA